MKSQTHYQVKTQIAGQIGNKKQQYLPHKWRGNTLVPVIIALAISAIATVAFLNQGANLAADNKSILAQNEIATIMTTWQTLRQSFAAGDIKQTTAQSGEILVPNSITRVTVYGNAITYTEATGTNAPKLAYITNSASDCTKLVPIVKKILMVKSTTACDGNNTAQLNIELD